MRHTFRLDGTRQAEVHHQDAAGLVSHDVLRLQVAVDDACAVGGVERHTYLANDLHRFLWRKLSLFPVQLSKVASFDKFHSDELHAVRFGKIVDADHVLVRHLVRGHQFLLESRQDRGIAGHLRADQFQGHYAFHFAVFRFIDRSHSAFAEQRQNLIAPAKDVSQLQHHILIGRNVRARAAGCPNSGVALAGSLGMDHSGAGVHRRSARRRFDKGSAVVVQRHFAGRAFAFCRCAQSATGVLASTWLGLQVIHDGTLRTRTHPYHRLGSDCLGPTA